jgi:hypothetical protein
VTTWNETMRELEERAAKRNAERRVRLERMAAQRAQRDEAERAQMDATMGWTDGSEEE